ncbi:MAG: DUF554 domain-containing protein [Angelakisella sp.]|nr:DUF554 domain-containing protein [Angelakisella sp.]
MTGTLINTGAVVAGSLIGMALKKGLNQRVEQTVTYVLGLSTSVIALNGLLSTMLKVKEGGSVGSSGEMLLLVSLVIGAVVGEIIRIEDGLNALGEQIEHKLHADNFAKGFISASLLFCVGAMTIMGTIYDGLRGDTSILVAKSMLDFIAAIILSSTLGIGVLFSAVTVLVYQGGLTLAAGLLEPVLVGSLLNNICMVGYAIVLCIGINFFGVIKIRTANLLPALLGPVVYNVLGMLKTL